MMDLPKNISIINKSSVPKHQTLLERWARGLDVFYIDNFGILLESLGKLDIDFSAAQRAWEEKDWAKLTTLQIELLNDWPDELKKEVCDIPRCAVFFLTSIDRKRYQLNRSNYGDCDRHIANLSLYELIVSCAYRQMNLYDVWKYDNIVRDLMAHHQPWFQWQTDVQRIVVWTRRREYENVIAWALFLSWKIDKLDCEKCRARYTRLVARARKEFQTVSAYGKPFNEGNYYGKLENQPDEYKEIMYLRKIRG